MKLTNGEIYYNHKFIETDVIVKKGNIAYVGKSCTEDQVIDLDGHYLIPGFIDIHSHGTVGYDFSTANLEEMHTMINYYLKNGITSVAATTMTMDYTEYLKALERISEYIKQDSLKTIVGINMEGPFISKERKGSHDIKYIMPLDEGKFNEMYEASEKNILVVDIAPELPNAMKFIQKNHNRVTVSLAHSTADYNLAMEAFQNGADHVTHIFNAMNGLMHREPGIIGAAFDAKAFCEIICDGIHINDTVLKIIFAAMKERLVVISDSMSGCGLEDGQYVLGGLPVNVKGKLATLKDGTIAGSVTNIYEAFVYMVKECHMDMEEVLPCFTENPAKSLKLFNKIGSIEEGKYADFVEIDKDFNIIHVYKRGNKII